VKFVAELGLAIDVLHWRPPQGWSVAQIVHHLILAEKMMMPIWTIVPSLSRWPRLVNAMGRANAVLWRALGMKTIEPIDERIVPSNASAGRFRTPVFLDPRPRLFDYNQLLERRRSTRAQTRRAVELLDDATLMRASWILPHSGSYSLMELVRFIGIHEMHHVPQIRRIRELCGTAPR